VKTKKLFVGFCSIIFFGVILRLFVFDVIWVTSDKQIPQFFPGDLLLILKKSSASYGDWVLLNNYPSPSVFSLRKLKEMNDTEFIIFEDKSPEGKISENSLLLGGYEGKVLFVLWSLPCKGNAQESNNYCSQKGFRFFKSIRSD
jgi:hypothetical protein